MIYPLLTWVVDVPGFTITVLADAVSEVLTVPAGAYYGWKTTGAEAAPGLRQATADSLAAVMTAALGTHSELRSSTAYYGENPNTVPASVPCWTIDDTGADWTITATSNAAALALFGLETGELYAEAPSSAIARRTAGVWRPTFAPPATLEPDLVPIGSGAISEYNPGAYSRILLSYRRIWSVLWEFVPAADISRSFALLNDYLPDASRATGDTAGVLDDVLSCLSQGAPVYLALPPQGTAAVDYREVIVDNSGSLTRSQYTTEAGAGARRYHVTMPLTETADADPNTP